MLGLYFRCHWEIETTQTPVRRIAPPPPPRQNKSPECASFPGSVKAQLTCWRDGTCLSYPSQRFQLCEWWMLHVPLVCLLFLSMNIHTMLWWVSLLLSGVICSWCCDHDAKSVTITTRGLFPLALGSYASSACCPACMCPVSGRLGCRAV